MAFSEDVFPPDDRCEICGSGLDDEIVIQEFADGSLARLCAECAAGAALGPDPRAMGYLPGPAIADAPRAGDADPLDVTKELLSPVVDLMALQGEMQAALERLASSLERFAAGFLTEHLDKTAMVEDRVQSLEQELERTRSRLHEAETLLNAAAAPTADAGGRGHGHRGGWRRSAQAADLVWAAADPGGPAETTGATAHPGHPGRRPHRPRRSAAGSAPR